MTLLRRLGLRGRLAIALAGVAVVAVALTTLLANAGLERRLRDAADARLSASATHSAQLAAELYGEQRRWTASTLAELEHLAEMNGYRIAVEDAHGRPLTRQGLPGDQATAVIRFDGRTVGAVVVAPFDGTALTPQDEHLRHRLNSLHVVAGLLALVLGALAALLLAPRLARPLRQLADVATDMQRGNLDVRFDSGGGPEVERVGDALNRLSETLRREEEIRRDAAADVAHELRTPLGGIVSRIEAAQDGVLTDEAENLSAIHTEALRLTRLVEDLSRLADAQKPGLLLDKQPVDLAAVARRRAGTYMEFFRAKDITLDLHLDHAEVVGDPGRMDQVVDNLISNALRYTDAGGLVEVVVRPVDGEVELSVRDTGIGIAAGDLPHVFQRFWRGEKSRSRATGGAGIGLAIVRELVRAHDGRIDVASAPGEGTRFTVWLPGRR